MRRKESKGEVKPLINNNPRAHGGARQNSGRKPSAYTLLKRRVIAEQIDEAEKSFDFYVQVRDNPEEPTELRLAAADKILDRVLGKPRNTLELDDGKWKKYHDALDKFIRARESDSQGESKNEESK